MAKQTKPKQKLPAIKGTWEDVIKASVSGNPKTQPKRKPITPDNLKAAKFKFNDGIFVLDEIKVKFKSNSIKSFECEGISPTKLGELLYQKLKPSKSVLSD
jgi:hypothetical protein